MQKIKNINTEGQIELYTLDQIVNGNPGVIYQNIHDPNIILMSVFGRSDYVFNMLGIKGQRFDHKSNFKELEGSYKLFKGTLEVE